MIGNPEGDLSRSKYEVTVVPNPKLRSPSKMPVDPRTTNLQFGLNQVTSVTSQVLACIEQSNSNGKPISGSMRFDIGNSGIEDSVISTDAGDVMVTSDRSNYLMLSGAKDAINSALKTLRIYRAGSSLRLSSTLYVRLSAVVTGLTLYTQSDCSDARASQIKTVKITPIGLTQIRSFTILPKNGRQNN
jgi:hypothetical protein